MRVFRCRSFADEEGHDLVPALAPGRILVMRGVRARFLDHRRGLGASLAVCLALSLATATAAVAPRLVAVGDVHGDVAAFQKILREAGVVDADGAWVGGETVLVQLGDLIDRGPSMRGTLDFVMGLEQKASARGGRVVSLLGNHEVMNVTGDLRYVTAGNYAEFADAGSEKRRVDAWSQVRALRKSRARKLGQPEPRSGREAREKWFEAHPPGYLEHREAFGPDGTYGRWLRARPALHLARGTAFMHGGLSPALAGSSLEEIDRRVHEDLARFDADMALFESEGLILPFFDLQETRQAVQDELRALDAAEAAARGAAEQSGKTYTAPPGDAKRREIYQRFLNWGSWTINSADGPLWFRGFAQWSDAEGEAELPRLLAAAGVERFVVGHSVQEDRRIRVRFGGAVFLIDTGMLASYVPGGRASALEIGDGIVSAIYAGEPRAVIWQSARPAAGISRPRVVFARIVARVTAETSRLLERRRRLAGRIEDLIRERGAVAVLFTWFW
jgi:Calcineurin-like phosphoesterase